MLSDIRKCQMRQRRKGPKGKRKKRRVPRSQPGWTKMTTTSYKFRHCLISNTCVSFWLYCLLNLFLYFVIFSLDICSYASCPNLLWCFYIWNVLFQRFPRRAWSQTQPGWSTTSCLSSFSAWLSSYFSSPRPAPSPSTTLPPTLWPVGLYLWMGSATRTAPPSSSWPWAKWACYPLSYNFLND